MLPATAAGGPPAWASAWQRWASRLVVVVFPFEPVIATMGPFANHDAASISETTGTPVSRKCCTSGASVGTPGETTARSACSARAV